MGDMFGKTPVVIKEDGHYDKSGNQWLFALVLIFLAVLFIAFRRERHDEGGLNNLLPFGAAMLGNKRCGALDEDWKLVELIKDQARDTGKIIHDVDKTTAHLQHSLDLQNCTTQKMIGEVIGNQNRCAQESERLYNQRCVDEMRDRLAEKDRLILQNEAKFLQEKTALAIAQGNSEINYRIARIEEGMLKRPPFIPTGGAPAVNMGHYAPSC